MAKKTVSTKTPDQLAAEAVDIFEALGDECFEDYMQRQWDEGRARGFEEAIAMVAKFVLDRAAELWKRADGDNDGDFRTQLEANALRKLSREIARIKREKS